MSTFTPATSMGANLLYALKGDSNADILDQALPLDPTVAAAAVDVLTGRGMSIVANKWVMGLSTATSLPYFLFAGLDANNSPDVNRPSTGPYRGMPYAGAARAVGWSAFSRLELATTGFLGSDTYTVGLPLTISAAASASGNRGLVCLQSVSTQPIVGYVSAAQTRTNEYGYPVVAFYPTFVAGSTLRTL